MGKLPRDLSGRQIVTILNKVGFNIARQKRSHIILKRNNPYAVVVVPDHKRVDTGTLAQILRGAGVSSEEFSLLLKGK